MNALTKYEQYRAYRKARSAHKAERKAALKESKIGKPGGKKPTQPPKFDPRYDLD